MTPNVGILSDILAIDQACVDIMSLNSHTQKAGCRLSTATSLLRIGQKACHYAEKRKIGTHLKDELNAGFVGKPTEKRRAKTTKTEHQSKEHSCYQPYLVWHKIGGIHHY